MTCQVHIELRKQSYLRYTQGYDLLILKQPWMYSGSTWGGTAF